MERRTLLGGFAGLATGSALANTQAQARTQAPQAQLDGGALGLVPNSAVDQTANFKTALSKASAKGAALALPGGEYFISSLVLGEGAVLLGHGGVVLRTKSKQPILMARGKSNISIRGISFKGPGLKASGKTKALVYLENCTNLRVRDCGFENSNGNGLTLETCTGYIEYNAFSHIEETGLFANNSKQLLISSNRVDDIGNNGIQVWRSEKGEDGTIVAHNHISNVETRAGGTGQNGNGINVYRANNVQLLGNHITDCAYSAMRNNGSDNCQMVGNHCARLGEVAIYSEFAFEGAVISQNVVDGAWTGISITNFNDGGRLAVCQGNLIRNLKVRDGLPAAGIAIEADTTVCGNTIENSDGFGISAGWKHYLRDVVIGHNLIRECHVGIGISSHFDAGLVSVTSNMIMKSKYGAIRALDGHKAVGKDLATTSSEHFRHFNLEGNVAR